MVRRLELCDNSIGESYADVCWAAALWSVCLGTQEAANLATLDILDFGGRLGSYLNAGTGIT